MQQAILPATAFLFFCARYEHQSLTGIVTKLFL